MNAIIMPRTAMPRSPPATLPTIAPVPKPLVLAVGTALADIVDPGELAPVGETLANELV